MERVNKFQEILRHGDARRASFFIGSLEAGDLSDNELRSLHDLVIEKGTAEDIYLAAYNTPRAKRDVARLQKALLASPNNLACLVSFAYEISGADLETIGAIVAKSGSLEDIKTFLDIDNLPETIANELRAVQNALLTQKVQEAVSYNDPVLARSLVSEPGVDIAALQRVVVDHGNANDLFTFAVNLPPGSGGDIAVLEDAFLRLEPYDERVALYFMAVVSEADRNKFGRAAAERGSRNHIQKVLDNIIGLSEETRTSLQRASDRLAREVTQDRPARSSSLGL